MKITTEMLAVQIAARCIDPYTAGHDSLAVARRINAEEGWTFERSAPLGSVLVTSEVHVSDAALLAAHSYAVEHYLDLV